MKLKTIHQQNLQIYKKNKARKQTTFGSASVKFGNILCIRGGFTVSEERRESMALYDFDEDKCVCSQKHQTRHPQL